jgi:hypothetical protein
LNVGAVYVLAVSNITLIGIFMAGWASNNKYSFLGAMRAVAQNISYEIPMLLSLMCVILLAGSMKFSDIVAAQGTIPFLVLQPIAFLTYLICSVAESNRTPFDIPEAESELVAVMHRNSPACASPCSSASTRSFVPRSSRSARGWNGPARPGGSSLRPIRHLAVAALDVSPTAGGSTDDQPKFLLPIAIIICCSRR